MAGQKRGQVAIRQPAFGNVDQQSLGHRGIGGPHLREIGTGIEKEPAWRCGDLKPQRDTKNREGIKYFYPTATADARGEVLSR